MYFTRDLRVLTVFSSIGQVCAQNSWKIKERERTGEKERGRGAIRGRILVIR